MVSWGVLSSFKYADRWKKKANVASARSHKLLVDLDETDADIQEKSSFAIGRTSTLESNRPVSYDVGRVTRSITPALEGKRSMFKGTWCSRFAEKWIVIPEPGAGQVLHWIDVWDIFVWWATLVTVFYVPYDLVFYKDDGYRGYVIHATLNLIFTLDMLVTFFIAYKISSDNSKAKYTQLWEQDPAQIAWRYIKPVPQGGYKSGWFLADLLCVAPGWCELFYSHHKALRKWSRLALVARFLAPLVQPFVARRSRWDRLVERVHVQYGNIFRAAGKVANFALLTAAICHWIACAWIAIEGHAINGLVTYKTESEHTWLTELISAKGDPCISGGHPDNFCYYVVALYWAWTTLSSVGYGDIIPMNYAEYVVCTASIIISYFLSAYVIASFASLVSSLIDTHTVQLEQDLQLLDNMLDSRHVDPQLKMRVRAYMYRSAEAMRLRAQSSFLESHRLSHSLQCEVANETLRQVDLWASVFWTKRLKHKVLLDMTRVLLPQFYGPHEEVVSNGSFMLIMRSGLAAYRGHVLLRGDSWGHESILLTSPGLLDRKPLKILSYSDALQLSKNDLQFICHQHPKTDAALRRVQVRTAVRRAIILIAQFSREGKSLALAQAFILDRDQSKHFRVVDRQSFADTGRIKLLKQGTEGSQLSGSAPSPTMQNFHCRANEHASVSAPSLPSVSRALTPKRSLRWEQDQDPDSMQSKLDQVLSTLKRIEEKQMDLVFHYAHEAMFEPREMVETADDYSGRIRSAHTH